MSKDAGTAFPDARHELADATPASLHQLPADKLYWSVLDAPHGARIRAGLLPVGLRVAFDEDVPQPPAKGEAASALLEEAGDLHVVCTPISNGRIIACGAPICELRLVAGHRLTLTPSELPAFIRDELDTSAPTKAIAASLNLLVGELEPACMKAARLRRAVTILLTSLLIAVLAIIGLDRRVRNERDLARAATGSADTAALELGQRLSVPVRVTTDTLPALLAVAQRSADAAGRISVPLDASSGLAALLERWPPDGATTDAVWSCTVQSLSASGEVIDITLTITGDASAFLRVLSPPLGWVIAEPRLTSIGRATSRKPATGADEDPSQHDGLALTRISLGLRREDQSRATTSGGPSP